MFLKNVNPTHNLIFTKQDLKLLIIQLSKSHLQENNSVFNWNGNGERSTKKLNPLHPPTDAKISRGKLDVLSRTVYSKLKLLCTNKITHGVRGVISQLCSFYVAYNYVVKGALSLYNAMLFFMTFCHQIMSPSYNHCVAFLIHSCCT